MSGGGPILPIGYFRAGEGYGRLLPERVKSSTGSGASRDDSPRRIGTTTGVTRCSKRILDRSNTQGGAESEQRYRSQEGNQEEAGEDPAAKKGGQEGEEGRKVIGLTSGCAWRSESVFATLSVALVHGRFLAAMGHRSAFRDTVSVGLAALVGAASLERRREGPICRRFAVTADPSQR